MPFNWFRGIVWECYVSSLEVIGSNPGWFAPFFLFFCNFNFTNLYNKKANSSDSPYIFSKESSLLNAFCSAVHTVRVRFFSADLRPKKRELFRLGNVRVVQKNLYNFQINQQQKLTNQTKNQLTRTKLPRKKPRFSWKFHPNVILKISAIL